MFKSTFGDRLRMLRTEKELSQDEMAVDFVNKIGVIITKSSISYYENNKRHPDQKTLGLLADYFDVTVDYILCRTNDRKATTPPDDGLHEDNIQYRKYSEIFDQLHRRLIEEGILKEGQDMTPDHLRLFLALGQETAITILKSKGIDPSILLK